MPGSPLGLACLGLILLNKECSSKTYLSKVVFQVILSSCTTFFSARESEGNLETSNDGIWHIHFFLPVSFPSLPDLSFVSLLGSETEPRGAGIKVKLLTSFKLLKRRKEKESGFRAQGEWSVRPLREERQEGKGWIMKIVKWLDYKEVGPGKRPSIKEGMTPGLGLSRYALSQQSFTFNLSTSLVGRPD